MHNPLARTTIQIEEQLLHQAKLRAVREGVTLRELFERCLRAELHGKLPPPRKQKSFWTLESSLQSTVKLTDAELRAARATFEKDWSKQ